MKYLTKTQRDAIARKDLDKRFQYLLVMLHAYMVDKYSIKETNVENDLKDFIEKLTK